MILPLGRIACRVILSSAVRHETDSGMKVNAIPGLGKKCSASARNPVHLAPEYAAVVETGNEALYEEIGRLKVELDWLKKKVGMLD
jgi:hypothetical protein